MSRIAYTGTMVIVNIYAQTERFVTTELIPFDL